MARLARALLVVFLACNFAVAQRHTAASATPTKVPDAPTPSAEADKARSILSTLKPTDLADHVLEPAAQAVTR